MSMDSFFSKPPKWKIKRKRSAKAATVRSPPRKYTTEGSSFSSLTCLFGSVGPNPLVLNPHNAVGPPKAQTGDMLPPKKNLSGRDDGLLRNPFPHGKTTPPEIPKLRAA